MYIVVFLEIFIIGFILGSSYNSYVMLVDDSDYFRFCELKNARVSYDYCIYVCVLRRVNRCRRSWTQLEHQVPRTRARVSVK